MRILRFFLNVFFSVGIFSAALAQSNSLKADLPKAEKFRTMDIGFHVGLTNGHTDIDESGFLSGNIEKQLAYGLSFTKFLSHNFGFQAQFITGKIHGKDKEKSNQYFYTTSIKYDASINAVFQIGNISFLKRSPDLAIYGFIGVGMIYFDPSSSWYVEDNLFLSDSTTPNVNYHNTRETIFPFGLGFKYRVDKNFSISAEYSLRLTNSDKLDGYNRFLSSDDNYSYVNIGLTYHLGKQEKVLEWNNPVDDIYNDLADAKGKVDQMSKDSDHDGVADFFDKEPDTPEGVKVYGNGVSVDSDGDGIPDYKDTEPYSSKGAKVDATGKELDSDHDGIPDSIDSEPNNPNVSSTVKNESPVVINMQANEQTNNSVSNLVNGYFPSVFFELNQSGVQKKYDEVLASIALIMRNNPSLKFEVIGNCDVRASEEYNINLGMKRAEAVKDHLVKRYGIDPSRLYPITKEKKEPITSEDHAMNRRVDFKVK